jgi:ferric-dicitrate binding protein FerR (iron transport regulator)
MEKEILNKYFSAEATREEEQQILEWIEASEENRRELERQRLVFDVALFSNKQDIKRRKTFSIVSVVAGVAATLAIIVGCFYFVSNYGDTSSAKWQAVVAPAGQQAQVTLPDGTKIWLSSKTQIKYQNDFGQSTRDVILDGEAYFEVTKNKEIPFTVRTEKDSVKVVGTHFNICAYKGSNIFETTLTEGIVDIYKPNATATITRLTKDERYTEIDGVGTKSRISSHDFLMWREGIYSFDDMLFPDIAVKLERYYNVKITIINSAVMHYRCTAKFSSHDSIEHILCVIQKDCPFQYTIDAEKKNITIK